MYSTFSVNKIWDFVCTNYNVNIHVLPNTANLLYYCLNHKTLNGQQLNLPNF